MLVNNGYTIINLLDYSVSPLVYHCVLLLLTLVLWVTVLLECIN